MRETVNRRDFVAKFMRDCGLTYDQALRVYASVVSTIEDGVINESKIGIGRVGALWPVRKAPRDIAMGFKRVNGGKIKKMKRVFHLDERTRWQFRLFREFEQKHHLNGK